MNPDDLHYTDSHEWVRVDGDIGTIGITDHAQKQLGEIVYLELPEVGHIYNAGRRVRHGRVGQGGLRALHAGLGRGRRGQQGRGRRARHHQRRPVRRRLADQAQALDRRRGRQADVGRRVRRVRARGRAGKVKFLPTSDAERAGDARRDRRRRRSTTSSPPSRQAVRQAPDLPPPMSEIEIRRFLGGLAAQERERARHGVLPRRRALQPLRLGDRRPDALPRRVADVLHAVPARGLAGDAPVDLRVPDAHLPADGPRGRQRLALRGRVGARRGAAHGRAPRRSGRTRAVALGRASTPSTARPCGPTSRTSASRSSRSRSAPTARRTRRRSRPRWTTTTFAVAVQSPNFLRRRRGLERRLGRRARRRARSRSRVVAEAVSLALLAPPGEGGADIACGEAQSLGVPMHNGGPLARLPRLPRREHQRQIPGPPRRADAGRRGPARLLPDALDARAAHPPREGDLEHLHEPGPDGARRQHPHVAARQGGPARGRRCSATRRRST